MVREGEPAPEVELLDQDGQQFRLSDHRGRPVVVYFYPKDETPGCTNEACTFRDEHAEFQRRGATVVGISDDDSASHRAFQRHHALPFSLLSDPRGDARKAFGVRKMFGIFPGRETFVIGPDGKVVRHIRGNANPRKHVLEALQTLPATESS